MKKNLVFLLMLTVLSLTVSCSSDDDTLGTINESFIIGKWQLSKSTKNGENIILDDCQLLAILEFNKKKQVIATTFEKNTDNVCEADPTVTNNYTIIDNTITYEGIQTAEITTPNNNTFVLTLNSILESKTFKNTYTRQLIEL